MSVAETARRPINRAVWSFWSKPFAGHYHRHWASERFHLLSWVLSFHTVGAHFAETALVTDSEGARLLVDRLQLPFDTVTTELDSLRDADPHWWMLGKLHTYRLQDTPFVHVDSDVYLWHPLAPELTTADIVAQNPEFAPTSDFTCYKPSFVTKELLAHGGWLPPEWLAYVWGGGATAICAGILGGCDTDSLRRYADRAIAIIERPENQTVWARGRIGGGHQILVEQYYLGAFCADMSGELDHPLRVRFVFSSATEAFDSSASKKAGYTHLIAGAKRRPDLERLVAERVARDYPMHYQKCWP